MPKANTPRRRTATTSKKASSATFRRGAIKVGCTCSKAAAKTYAKTRTSAARASTTRTAGRTKAAVKTSAKARCRTTAGRKSRTTS